MENQVIYNIVKSSLPGHHEVIITYVENGKSKQDVVFIQDKNNMSDATIIRLAKQEFNQKHEGKPKKSFVGFVKKHKTFSAVATIVLVGGIITGVAFGVVGAIKPNPNVPDDFDKMREAYKTYLIQTTSLTNYGDLSAEEIMNKIVIGTRKIDDTHTEPIYGTLVEKKISNVDTYFIKEIDYEDGFNRDSWPAATHVSQALNLAITAEVRKDSKIKDIAIKMTYYWVFNNYRNTNWWQNELGADNNLASLGLFVYNDLNPKGKAALRGRVAEASFYYNPSLLTHTGANLFDYADITLKSSIIAKNNTEFTNAVDRVEEEITDQKMEGFQTDGSFFQHGQQVQIGSYGKGVIRLGKVLRTMAESSRKFKTEKMAIVENYILRGLQNMTHKGYINYSAVSREIARENNLSALSNNFNQFNVYLELDAFSKRDELQKYLDNITDGQANDPGLIYFDKAKMIAVNVDGIYMSFKGTAPNLTNTECVNDENQLGLNLSYGTNTCVMDTGKEYFNVFPVWDFSFIPGTTSIQVSSDASLPSADDNNYKDLDANILKMRDVYGDQLYERQLPAPVDPDPAKGIEGNDYVYSGTESIDKSMEEGVAVLMQRSKHHDENDFTVTCIATANGMVLLGADLSYDGYATEKQIEGQNVCFEPGSRKMHTTLDQAFTTGDETLTENNKTFTKGNIVYHSFGDNEIKTVNRTITQGLWARNRAAKEDEILHPEKYYIKDGDDGTNWTKTTTAYIDYGNQRSGNKYAYSIQSKEKYETRPFKLIKNFDDNKNVQEVRLPDIQIPGVGTRKRTVVVAYEETKNYQPDIGDPINLAKGEYRVITVEG